MEVLIEVFKMDVLKIETRINLLIKLGRIINFKYGANITEPVVYELVKILDPENKQVETTEYLKNNQ